MQSQVPSPGLKFPDATRSVHGGDQTQRHVPRSAAPFSEAARPSTKMEHISPSRRDSLMTTTSSKTSSQRSYDRSLSTGGRSSSEISSGGGDSKPREIILRSFSPHIAVFASTDAEELVRLKGIYGGFRGLLRPFGESIQGRVVVRDSVGASRAWDDFGIHIDELGEKSSASYLGEGQATRRSKREGSTERAWNGVGHRPTDQGNLSSRLDEVLDRYSRLVEAEKSSPPGLDSKNVPANPLPESRPQYYELYLRKLLSTRRMVPYETLSQPVACMIAISSQNTTPIETLRELYSETRQGARSVPDWAGNEYLRYYVLIHDEEHDDITRSTALYEQMKRHFGLHCHLLRLRTSECVPTDDDSIRLPPCDWLSPEEELIELQRQENETDVEDYQQFIFESDGAAIRTFLREMVTQSIVPFMEARVIAWNDQVASRRRGISGRFMSLSKRWTGFGGSRSSLSGPANTSGSSGSNYDSSNELYPPDSPEAIMRRLADYALMLRDWKLSHSIYDLLRSDFSADKAWWYYAAANEMAAVSLLLNLDGPSFRGKTDSFELVDQLLDVATYSYMTRCASPYGTIRCLTVALELLRSRGGLGAESAAKWGARLLELTVLSPRAQTLTVERLALCFGSQNGVGRMNWASRRRKAAMWSMFASEQWLSLQSPISAQGALDMATPAYRSGIDGAGDNVFTAMSDFLADLQLDIKKKMSLPANAQEPNGDALHHVESTDEESVKVDAQAHQRVPSKVEIPGFTHSQVGNLLAAASPAGIVRHEEDEFV